MRIVMMIVYLLLICVGVSFAALNSSSITVNFYFTHLTLPVSIVIVCTLGLGLLAGFLTAFFKIMSIKYRLNHVRKQLKMTEKELINLRVMPLKDQH